jgi:hypothetical protein
MRRRCERDILAVPLSPAEATLQVTALREDDRLHRIHFWTHDGDAWSRSEAGALMQMAGVAAALGHAAVPALVQELGMYELVLSGLQRYAPQSQATQDFGQLLGKMHALSGMARVHRWQVEYGEAGLRWAGPPPSPDHGQAGGARRQALPGRRRPR